MESENKLEEKQPIYKEEIQLLPCKCCGCQMILSIIDNSVDLACSKKVFQPACSNYNAGCKDDTCSLQDLDTIQYEKALFERVILEIEKAMDRSDENDCLLTMDLSRITHLIKYFDSKWFYGEIQDNGGSYYRIFRTEDDYKNGLLKYIKRYGIASKEMELELFRLGLTSKIV